MQKNCIFFIVALFVFTKASATELQPWFGPPFVIEGRADTIVEYYSSLATEHGTVDRSTWAGYLDLSASLAIMDNWSAELEAIVADSHHSFHFDSVLLTGRYRWTNDIVGDFATISTGITISQIFTQGLHDISIFHHGGIAGEAHVSIGKEFSCEQFWTSRFWGVAGFGIADMGSPWVRGDAGWELNFCDQHLFGAYMYTLWGLGHNGLNAAKSFHGYGPINHQSVDFAVRYAYTLECQLTIGVEYAYRVYARNCPKQANFGVLRLRYPF